MAAHVLTSHGLKVLLLEAGKQLNTTKELHSMEWPYDHPRHGDMPPRYHPLTVNEYNIRNPPYAQGSAYPHVESYVQGWNGADYSKNMVVDEKDHPYTGTKYAWVRSRAVGGKTNIWGRLALRLSDYDFKAKSRDGYGEDWPISYADIAPYYDKVNLYLGISGHKENLPYLPDSIFQRPVKLTAAEAETPRQSRQEWTRADAVSRGRYHRRIEAQQISEPMFRPRRVRPPRRRLRYPRRFRFAHRPDSARHGHRQSYAAAQLHRVRELRWTRTPARRAASTSSMPKLARPTGAWPQRDAGASTLESARLLMLSKSTQHPNGLANSSGHVGHNFCEHIMGPGISGIVKDLVGKPRTIDNGRPGSFYLARFRNLSDKQNKFIRGYGFEGSSGTTMIPGQRFLHARLRHKL